MDELFEQTQKSQQSRFISVWGMPGVGKSALVKAIYLKLRTSDEFKRHVWVSVSHPFNSTDFCRSLHVNLQRESTSSQGEYANAFLTEDPIKECRDYLHECVCLFVIDGVQSHEDWDRIKYNLIQYGDSRSCIVIITSEESIAKHCAVPIDGVYNVKGLQATAAIELFEKALEENGYYLKEWEVREEARLLLSKCGDLPKVIITVARYLSTKARDVFIQEMRRLNDNFMHELVSKPEFDSLQDIQPWMHSFLDTCPRHMKKCMLYLSIFPQHIIIRRRRLIRRRIAERYSKGTDSSSTEKYAEKIFDEVAALSIMQPVLEAGKVIGYRVNGLFREYIMSRPVEETLLYPVEVSALEKQGHGRLATDGIGQHIAIGSMWGIDLVLFESLDSSRLRSMTVFNSIFWSHYVSDRMRMLRVLDLEDASQIYDNHFEEIAKLPSRLKFLSLRGQSAISRLPDAVGDLVQLQTLDIRGTSILTLPAFITKLRKLQYIRAGTTVAWMDDDISSCDGVEGSTPPSSNRLRSLASCLPNKFLRRGGPVVASRSGGVAVPRGIKRLEALQTLGAICVNTKAILAEIIFYHPQLKKLEISGISAKHGRSSLYFLDNKTHLESLSLQFERNNHFVHWEYFNIPRSLRSLKMHGHVEQLPRHMEYCDSLLKLTFEMTTLFTAEVIEVLGSIPNLQTLRLRVNKEQDGQLQFPADLFRKLHVLEIACKSKLHLRFDEGAMVKLEQLKLHCLRGLKMKFSGLEHPVSLKQVWLLRSFDDALMEAIQQQLVKHPKKPALKLRRW